MRVVTVEKGITAHASVVLLVVTIGIARTTRTANTEVYHFEVMKNQEEEEIPDHQEANTMKKRFQE